MSQNGKKDQTLERKADWVFLKQGRIDWSKIHTFTALIHLMSEDTEKQKIFIILSYSYLL